MQRNLARLGTRWQQNPVPPPKPNTAQDDAWWRGFFWGWFWGSWK